MAALLALVTLPRSALFLIERVDVTGTVRLDSDAVSALAGVRPGGALFAVDAEAVEARLRRHPWIRSARVTVRPPHRVLISIEERTPLFAMKGRDGYALVGDDLVVIDLVPDAGGLIEVVASDGVELPRPGATSPVGDIVRQALFALPHGFRGDVTAVVVARGPDLTFLMRSGLVIRAGGLSGLSDRLAQVPGVLAALRSKGMSAATVDLRYAGSVVISPAGGEAR